MSSLTIESLLWDFQHRFSISDRRYCRGSCFRFHLRHIGCLVISSSFWHHYCVVCLLRFDQPAQVIRTRGIMYRFMKSQTQVAIGLIHLSGYHVTEIQTNGDSEQHHSGDEYSTAYHITSITYIHTSCRYVGCTLLARGQRRQSRQPSSIRLLVDDSA